MSTATYATAADVEAAWRPFVGDEETRVEGLLRFALGILRTRVPDLDARAALGPPSGLDPQLVTDVLVEMVLRAMRNTGGVRQETVGPFSVTIDAMVAAGYVYVTDDEVAVLSAVAQRRVGSISVRATLL